MKKDAYYFSHDSNARHDPKLSALRAKYGWFGYGVYWAIIEVLRDQRDYKYPKELRYGLALATSYDPNSQECDPIKFDDFLTDLIALGLLKVDENSIYSESLISRMVALNESRERLSEAGKRGAETRWGGHKGANATPMAVKESKVKEIKVVDIDILSSIKTKPEYLIYQKLPLETEFGKMSAWLGSRPNRRMTKRFVLNWLNKCLEDFVEQPQKAAHRKQVL